MKKYIVLIIAMYSTLFSANISSNGRTLPHIPIVLGDAAGQTTWPPNARQPLFTFREPLWLAIEVEDNDNDRSDDSSHRSSDEFSYEDEWEDESVDEVSSESHGRHMPSELSDSDIEYEPYRRPIVSGPENMPQPPSRRAGQANSASLLTRLAQQQTLRLAARARAGIQTRNLTLHQRIGRFNHEMENAIARGRNPSPFQIRMRASLQREVLRSYNNAMHLESNDTYFVHNPDGTVYISYASDDE